MWGINRIKYWWWHQNYDFNNGRRESIYHRSDIFEMVNQKFMGNNMFWWDMSQSTFGDIKNEQTCNSGFEWCCDWRRMYFSDGVWLLIYMSGLIYTKWALEIKLVDKIVPRDDFVKTVDEFINSLTKKSAVSLTMAKMAIGKSCRIVI